MNEHGLIISINILIMQASRQTQKERKIRREKKLFRKKKSQRSKFIIGCVTV